MARRANCDVQCVPIGEDFGEIPESPTTPPETYGIKFAVDGPVTWGMRYHWTDGWHYPVQVASGGAISGQTLYVGFVTVVHTLNANNQVIHEDVSVWYGTYALSRTALDDASIDSRKVYGQPNLDGELPGDANADPRPTNFGTWVYHGGLFAGTMPWLTGDQSGIGRTQLYAPTVMHANTQLATLVMLDEGTRASLASSPTTLGLFCPAGGDANLNTTETGLTWTTRWTITPRATPSVPPDPTHDPTEKITFSGAASDYGSWNLAAVTTTAVTMPATGLTRMCVALDDEPDVLSTPTWRYFGSKEYQALFSTFPQNDCSPRLWVLDLSETQIGAYRAF